MIFVQFSLRSPLLGGAISKYCFTQKPEEPEIETKLPTTSRLVLTWARESDKAKLATNLRHRSTPVRTGG
jgi:hypothetical protein